MLCNHVKLEESTSQVSSGNINFFKCGRRGDPEISKDIQEYHLEMWAMWKYFGQDAGCTLGWLIAGSRHVVQRGGGRPENCIFILKSVELEYSWPFTQVWILRVSEGLDTMFYFVPKYLKQQFLVGFVIDWRFKPWTKVRTISVPLLPIYTSESECILWNQWNGSSGVDGFLTGLRVIMR